MNKYIWIVIVLAIIIVALIGILVFLPRNIVPGSVEQPIIGTQGLTIFSLRPNQEISSPLKITGVVNGNGWSGFEGQVGNVKLVVDGTVLAQVPLTAKGEWMTSAPINFETNLEFQVIGDKTGTLIFHNENPSGDPSKDKTFSLPVKIKGFQGETSVVKIYFMKSSDSNIDCKPSSSVDRIISKTQAIARATLEELLKGPTDYDLANGFSTIINPGVKINSLTIDDKGVARADFSQELESTGGSCRVTAIRAEITQTLEQFPTIKSVIISINGRTEDILQP